MYTCTSKRVMPSLLTWGIHVGFGRFANGTCPGPQRCFLYVEAFRGSTLDHRPPVTNSTAKRQAQTELLQQHGSQKQPRQTSPVTLNFCFHLGNITKTRSQVLWDVPQFHDCVFAEYQAPRDLAVFLAVFHVWSGRQEHTGGEATGEQCRRFFSCRGIDPV